MPAPGRHRIPFVVRPLRKQAPSLFPLRGLNPNSIAPLRSDPRIRKAPNQIRQSLPITHERSDVAGCFWNKHGGELRQYAMRQPRVLMMDPVVRLVEERVGKHTSKPAL